VQTSAELLAALILEHQPCVVLTGAGVSTESGIPDFRSPGGIWARYDPMEYATIEAFRRDPVKVWDFYARRFEVLEDAQPNPAHHVLAALERGGHVEAIVTQNIDRLHELAGSRNVIEVHGSIRTSGCLACGETASFEEVVRMLEHAPAPSCPRCGSILKPGVVMFGEEMPWHAMQRATELARRAGLLLVVGSSLNVYPVAGLPEETQAAGGRLAILNRGPTPFDARADLTIDAPAGETLVAVLRHVEQP
jgi:NAD-dependent deacetylase